MESKEIKDLPLSGFFKRAGDIVVPVLGLMSLLIITVRFRHTSDADSRLGLGVIALLVICVGAAYYQHRHRLGFLKEKVDEKNMAALYLFSWVSVMFAYLICNMALTLAAHN